MNVLAGLLWLSASLSGAASLERVEVASVVISAVEQIEVPARERGPLTAVAVEEGDLVAQDEVLATIDEGDAQLAGRRVRISLETARAEAENTTRVRLARKALELAQSELARGHRSRALFENAITEEEIQMRQLAADKAARAVQLAENELRIAERNLVRCRIQAPVAGIVTQVRHRGGEWVEPGQSVVRIVRLDALRAEGFLAARDARHVAAGNPVTLTVELPEGGTRAYAGTLKFLSPEINPVDGRVRVWAWIANPGMELRPGMRASMTVQPSPQVP
jgi:RND family efflux transporter MFP subunit